MALEVKANGAGEEKKVEETSNIQLVPKFMAGVKCEVNNNLHYIDD
jgi:hypothetical protein